MATRSTVAKDRPRICIIGWGAIARRTAAMLAARGTAELVAVGLRAGREHEALPAGATLIHDPAQLDGLAIDLVCEAASREAVATWAEPVLQRGLPFIVSSTAALIDDALRDRLIAAAKGGGGQLVVPAGALGGIGALAAASRLPIESVMHSIVKPPAAWRGTAAESLVDLDGVEKRAVFFVGNAREAAQRFPANANVAAISALAGVGFERTKVELVVDPQASRNIHEVNATGDFGTLCLRLENAALADNLKSSAMAALSLVRAIENRTATIVI